MNNDTIVMAVRKMVSAVLGVSSLAESGNGPPLSSVRSKFGAYRTLSGQRITDPVANGFAVMDELVLRNIEVFFVVQRVAGDEGLSTVRRGIDALAEAATLDTRGQHSGQPPAWDETGRIAWCHVVDFGEGGPEEYGHLFAGSGTWCAGHLTLELMYGA